MYRMEGMQEGEHEVAEYQYGERMSMTFEALNNLRSILAAFRTKD